MLQYFCANVKIICMVLVFSCVKVYHIHMKYQIVGNKIIFKKNDDFDAKSILSCGQMFRFFETENGFDVISGKNLAHVFEEGENVVILSDSPKRFVEFFDLDTDYGAIKKKLSSEPILKEAIEFGKGIRIAKGESEEIIFQFIVSQNNNIKRIQKIIEKMCVVGEKINEKYNAFPSAKVLANQPEEFFKNLGAGYRDKYLFQTAKILANTNLSEKQKLSTKELEAWLLLLPGVGPKVASCILLFGFNRQECFPVDTWIEKVYRKFFFAGEKTRPEISAFLSEKFETMSGIVQQYLFNFFQKNKIEI